MVTLKKTAAGLLAAMLFLLGGTGNAFALEGRVEYTGGAEKFIFLPEGDLFSAMKSLVPGAVATMDITIRNSTVRSDLYLSSEGGDELLAPLTLTLTLVTAEGKELPLYAGPANGSTNGFIHLGDYKKGQTALLRATLTVPKELDNSYMDASGKIKWIFAATQYTFPSDDDDDDDSVTVTVPPVIKPYVKPGVLPETGSSGTL
ncbi:MAG: hypothetical protein RSF82_00355 [Angelakisella sp.]